MVSQHFRFYSTFLSCILLTIILLNLSPISSNALKLQKPQGSTWTESNIITPCNASYFMNPQITLNGIGNEACWQNPPTTQYTVPVSTLNDSDDPTYSNTLYVKIVYNNSDLYVLIWWASQLLDNLRAVMGFRFAGMLIAQIIM